MVALGEGPRAAHVALWAEVHGGMALHKVEVQDKLVAWFATAGRPVAGLAARLTYPRDGTGEDLVQEWKEFWEAVCDDAEIAAKSDRADLRSWVKARSFPAADGASGGVGDVILNSLRSTGVAVDGPQSLALHRALKSHEEQTEGEQCRSPQVVAILHLGRTWSDVELPQFMEARARAGEGGLVDIRWLPFYGKLTKGNSLPVFERAVRLVASFEEWKVRTQAALQAAQLPLAAHRLSMVLARAHRIAKGDVVGVMNYMSNYIMEDHMGLGLPVVFSAESAIYAGERGPTPHTPHLKDRYDTMLAAADPRASPAAILAASLGLESTERPGPPPAQLVHRSGPPTVDLGSISGSSVGRSSAAGSSVAGSSYSAVATPAQEMLAFQEFLREQRKEQNDLLARMESLASGRAALPPKGPGAKCDFCYSATCEGNCRQYRQGLQHVREQAKLKEAKRVEQAAAKFAREQGGGAGGEE